VACRPQPASICRQSIASPLYLRAETTMLR
jgi:hypothetical protein